MALNAQEIIAEAEALVGIPDPETGPCRNLERLCDALSREFAMSETGEQTVRKGLVRDAVNRLEAIKWLRDYPEAAGEPIEAPVFLCGLPRSGTTYFQYLFDRDERFRLIRTWESSAPFPPPGFAPDTIPIRREAWRIRRGANKLADGFDAMHLMDDDGSDECHNLLGQSYGGVGLENTLRAPSYFDYLLDEADMAETYSIHKRQLQLLQWRSARKPWALKYPNHVIALDALLEVYPDARIVMTHRDPVQVLGSICKMTHLIRQGRAAGPLDRAEAGRDMLHFITRHIDRIMAFDTGPHGDRVVHVDYYALLADPVRAMHAIHKGIGIDTPDSVAQSIQAWRDANPKNKRGANDYALEEYGLDQAEVARRFAPYMARFAIPREHEGLARVGVEA